MTFDEWYQEVGFRSETGGKELFRDCWNAAYEAGVKSFKLPEKYEMDLEKYGQLAHCARGGWNDCLDEIKKMNGISEGK